MNVMNATPTATPTTIPATVPLGSLLGDGGADVVAGAFEAELLLIKVLRLVLGLVFGLVLLGVKVIGVEVPLELGSVPEVADGVEEMLMLLIAGLAAVDVGASGVPLLPLEEAKARV